jgi:hypothetical protein
MSSDAGLELCDGASSVAAIAQIIMTEFEAAAGVALSDVMHFVTELADVGALLVEDAA